MLSFQTLAFAHLSIEPVSKAELLKHPSISSFLTYQPLLNVECRVLPKLMRHACTAENNSAGDISPCTSQ